VGVKAATRNAVGTAKSKLGAVTDIESAFVIGDRGDRHREVLLIERADPFEIFDFQGEPATRVEHIEQSVTQRLITSPRGLHKATGFVPVEAKDVSPNGSGVLDPDETLTLTAATPGDYGYDPDRAS
jgi:hypothetical protein